MKTITWIIVIGLLLACAPTGRACTNYLVSKGASADGSTIITYSADSHELYGELNFIPAGEHIEGTSIDVYEGDTGKYLGKVTHPPYPKQWYQRIIKETGERYRMPEEKKKE